MIMVSIILFHWLEQQQLYNIIYASRKDIRERGWTRDKGNKVNFCAPPP